MNGKHWKKTPKIAPGTMPSATRLPRADVPGTQGTTPAWNFHLMDFDGPWSPVSMDQRLLVYVIRKLSEYESMTWGAIEGAHSHAIDVWQIGKQAQNRLIELRQDDIEELFSLRLSGRERVWGIRDGRILKLLWWDPEHQVYPVRKKHT